MGQNTNFNEQTHSQQRTIQCKAYRIGPQLPPSAQQRPGPHGSRWNIKTKIIT